MSGMMLLVALMILWQYRTLSHPLRHQRQTLGSVSFFIFGTDPLALSGCSTWCFSARQTNWLQAAWAKTKCFSACTTICFCLFTVSFSLSLTVCLTYTFQWHNYYMYNTCCQNCHKSQFQTIDKRRFLL